MTEKDDFKLRALLKASPSLKPPESFYKGVLEKIKTKGQRDEGTKRNTLFPFVSPSLRPSVGLFATACILMVIVLATRESKNSQPELFQPVMQTTHSPALTNGKLIAPLPIRAQNKSTRRSTVMTGSDIQSRMDPNISNLVGKPSPFEEVDKEDAKALSAGPSLAAKSFGGIRAQDISMNSTMKALPTAAAVGGGMGSTGKAEVLSMPYSAADVASAMPKRTDKGFEIAGPVAERKILEKPLPLYPEWAKDAAIEAMVRLYIRINADGAVNPIVHITTSTGYSDLDQAAVGAVKKWKFAPDNAESWGIVTFQFPPRK